MPPVNVMDAEPHDTCVPSAIAGKDIPLDTALGNTSTFKPQVSNIMYLSPSLKAAPWKPSSAQV
jgi:hypothetical protein